jgi:hypothetical protein
LSYSCSTDCDRLFDNLFLAYFLLTVPRYIGKIIWRVWEREEGRRDSIVNTRVTDPNAYPNSKKSKRF